MTRRIAFALLTPALLATSACEDLVDLIDPPEFSEARIDVDPTIVRTIHYGAVNGRPHVPETEVTTKRVEEIECLRQAPGCRLSEVIHVSVMNTGTRTLFLHADSYEFDVFSEGSWHRIDPGATIAVKIPPVVIAPGEKVEAPVPVYDLPPGVYRIRLAFQWKGSVYISLPDEASTSQPFYFQPLPDYRAF
jgi:hypothetical protein